MRDSSEGSSSARRRRTELSDRARWQTSLIGVCTGLALVGLGLRPTGSAPVDGLLLAGSVGFVIWCGCTAPWWILVLGGTASVALNPFGIGTGLALLAVGLAVWVGLQQRSKPVVRAGVIALVLLSLSFIGTFGAFGVSGLIGTAVAVIIAVGGMTRRPREDRRIAQGVVGIGLALGFACIAFAGFAAFSARGSLRDANQQTRSGLAAMRAADFETASEEFDRAATSFERADRSLSAPWVQPARLLPVVAQQWNAAHTVTNAAVNASDEVGVNAGRVDVGNLQFNDGQVDIEAIKELEKPLNRVQVAIGDLDRAMSDAASPWLYPEFSQRLDSLAADIDEQRRLGARVLKALDVAPAMLGADGERHYFVMFTTPAEARGQGGFMGSYGEVTVDDGKISIEQIGRTNDLNRALEQPVVLNDAPADWMASWGSFGFSKPPDDRVSDEAWSIINLSGHFPNTAQVIAELYPKSGGDQLDGVFSMDVYALEALVGLVGPIEVPDGPTLDGTNTAEYLLLDQYRSLGDQDFESVNSTRVDALERIAEDVGDRLLETNPPDPLELGRTLAPFASEHRVLGWSPNPDEQALLETIDIDGRVLDPGDVTVDDVVRSAVKITTNNASGSKIDSFLGLSTKVERNVVTVELTNRAPSSGFPRYVIGSVLNDRDFGVNRMLLSIYSTDEISNIVVDGEAESVEPQREAERFLYTLSIKIPPGQTSVVSFTTEANPLVVNKPPPGRRPQS